MNKVQAEKQTNEYSFENMSIIFPCWLHLHQLISVKPKRPGQPSRLLLHLNQSLRTDGGRLWC